MAVIKGARRCAAGRRSADPRRRRALAGLDALNSGLEAVTTGQTLIGARLAWIDLTNERRTTLGELQCGRRGRHRRRPTSPPPSSDLQQIMTVLEASQASFARLASLTLFDLMR